jgi:hypothetical protein
MFCNAVKLTANDLGGLILNSDLIIDVSES